MEPIDYERMLRSFLIENSLEYRSNNNNSSNLGDLEYLKLRKATKF